MVRPGRMDIVLKLDNMRASAMRDMLKTLCAGGEEVTDDELVALDGKLSPAAAVSMALNAKTAEQAILTMRAMVADKVKS